MRRVHDVAEIRAAERKLMATLPEGTLMQRAATALARRCAELLERVYGARVVVLVGKGNNGGDALYAGARLAGRGARVDAIRIADAEPPAALDALVRAGGHDHEFADASARGLIEAADLVIDGLVGIGATGALRGAAKTVVEFLDGADGLVVAVDVPSGVDASTGRVDGTAVRADVTVTFGALKPGLVVAPGAHQVGLLEVVDIGLDPVLPSPATVVPDADDIAALVPVLDARVELDKYRRGVVGVVSGSSAYTGAAVLATGGALTAGAGMVRFVSTAEPAAFVRAAWPEAVVTVVESGDGKAVVDVGRVQAWVVGPGLGTGDDAAAVVRAVLGTDVPVLVDADALTIVGEHREWLDRSAPTLLTPHAGEFARLFGADRDDVERNRLERVRKAAAELAVTVLLKGSTTVVADPSGRTSINPTGTPALGTAGSGDVLSGACGALLARGLGTFEAATAGAFLHGLAGRLAAAAGATIVASDLIGSWPAAVRTVHEA
jgi:ADP-dependent NAD(P)H-hydrate dehydratase / NAD(P)H-hydrate epimerase